MLRSVPYADSIGKRLQTQFGGINHMPACADGEIYDCGNLSSDRWPLLSPRKKRGLVRTLADPNGLGGRDKLCWVDGTKFYYDGTEKGTVEDSRKRFYYIGPYIVIMPDKKYYNTALDVFGSLEETYTGGAGAISFADGTYAGVSASKNSIVTTGSAFSFDVGDAVTVSGSTSNNSTFIIREISDDKKTLRFYEEAFTNETPAGSVTIKREVPDMDYLCECNNRLWGCKGDTIYASKLGNPKVWKDYDGLAQGSWTVDVGSAGDFTGCASLTGYPTFFKADIIHKVYGSKPSDFQTDDGTRTGLKSGCDRSLAIAGDILFYRAPVGMVRYYGGYAYECGEELGSYTPDNAVAGSDGRRYYVSGDIPGGHILLSYDASTKIWLREDDTEVLDFANTENGLYFLAADGKVWKVEDDSSTTEEETLTWFAEFGEFYEGSPQRKGLSGIQIRSEGTITVKLAFDGGSFESIGTLTGTKAMHKLSIVPRRCDCWRLRLEGTGDATIYAIARELYTGSDMN